MSSALTNDLPYIGIQLESGITVTVFGLGDLISKSSIVYYACTELTPDWAVWFIHSTCPWAFVRCTRHLPASLERRCRWCCVRTIEGSAVYRAPKQRDTRAEGARRGCRFLFFKDSEKHFSIYVTNTSVYLWITSIIPGQRSVWRRQGKGQMELLPRGRKLPGIVRVGGRNHHVSLLLPPSSKVLTALGS
jgi:hypothetical protein